MNEKKKQYYLYINGEAVPVTEKVYKTFWYFEDKEDYFMRQLKIPRRTQDKETCESVVVPAREVPMEEYSVWCKKARRLSANGWDEQYHRSSDHS